MLSVIRGEAGIGGDDGFAGFVLEGSGDGSKGLTGWEVIKNGGMVFVVWSGPVVRLGHK